MDQEGLKWLAWRKLGIGSSQVAAIMGLSPYQTPQQVFQEKVSDFPPEDKTNFVMEKGKRNEAPARALFELEMQKDFPAKCLVMEEYSYMRCSLDGICEDEILELKYTGMKPKFPHHYMLQVQYQMIITNARIAWYQPYNIWNVNGTERVILHPKVEVLPDRKMQREIFLTCSNFWVRVVNRRWE